MADDGEIRIGTKIDESGIDKGLKSVKSKVNNAAKDMNNGAKAANEAYKVQEKAEKALQKAADNNPYLNGESVRNPRARQHFFSRLNEI